jgi:glycosyltransferase involved in cell wall biosynthesis
MKILTLNHEFPPVGGGASPVTFELCTELVRQGHTVDVVTMHYKNTPNFENINGINIYRTPALRKSPNICHPHELATYLPGAFLKTLSLAKKNKYDIIHCHFIVPGSPLAWLISNLTGIPFIVTCHGSDVPGHNPDRFILLHKIIKPLWKFFARKAEVIITPSKFLKQKVLQVDQTLKVEVIPNGLDISRFNTNEKTKSILLCSRIFKFKGMQYFIEAVKDLQLGWEINIIGDGPYLPELKALAGNSKTPIKFHGWLDKNSKEYINLYSEASIFIFLSEAESFGLVVAEAMAAGCAIIASDIPAHREVLGDTGIFVEACNAGLIKTALEKLISDEKLRQDFQKQTRGRVCEKFSWDKIADEYVKLYENYVRKTNAERIS